MKVLLHAAVLIAASTVVLLGCGHHEHHQTAHDDAPAAAPAAVPDALFAGDAPGSATAVGAARSAVSVGDAVVIEGRIGGQREVFLRDRAVFFVTDRGLVSCRELHPDGACRTPWDYCCEPPDNLARNLATVQVVDERGKPLPGTLSGQHGLEPLAMVVIEGVVSEINAGGAFVVDATRIVVTGG